MRKLFFILLFPVLAYGQDTKVQDLDPATSPDANDIMYFEQDGVAKNITRALLLDDLSDSVGVVIDTTVVLRTDTNTNTNDIDALELIDWRTITTNDTIDLTDSDEGVLMAIDSDANLTVPPNSEKAFRVGTEIKIVITGAGQATIVEGAGVTVNSEDGYMSIEDQYSVANLLKISTDTWLLGGDLSPTGGGSDFEGTVVHRVTFSELPPDVNTEARARTFLDSDAIVRSSFLNDSLYCDSTVIVTNDMSATDTVQQIRILAGSGGAATRNKGMNWQGEIQVEGVPQGYGKLNLSYFMRLPLEWDWGTLSKGGKLPGLSGFDEDGDWGPSASVKHCSCADKQYCDDDGFTIRGGWDSGPEDIGFYTYNHGLAPTYPGCDPLYAYDWNKQTVHGTGALTWELEKWYKITHRLVLNDVGSANGILEWARNDTVYMSKTDVRFIKDSDIKIDYWHLCTFAGGDEDDAYLGAWVWFDDFTIWYEAKEDEYGYEAVMTNVPDMATPNYSE